MGQSHRQPSSSIHLDRGEIVIIIDEDARVEECLDGDVTNGRSGG
jgi:hypothetical protein